MDSAALRSTLASSLAVLAATAAACNSSRSTAPSGSTASSTPAASAPASAPPGPSAKPFPTLEPKTPDDLRDIATYTRTATKDDVSELRRAVDTSKNEVVVGSSLLALARLEAIEVDADFEKLLDDPRRRVRNDAIVALGMSGDPRTIEMLKRKLDPDSPQDRVVALGALKRIGSAEAQRVIAEALADPRATALDRRMAGVEEAR